MLKETVEEQAKNKVEGKTKQAFDYDVVLGKGKEPNAIEKKGLDTEGTNSIGQGQRKGYCG